MTLQQKIQAHLKSLQDRKGMKQAQIAKICQISSGTISDLMGNKKEFSDKLLNLIAERIKSYTEGDNTHIVKDLTQYKMMQNIAKSCKENAFFALVTGDTAIGKTLTFKQYVSHTKNAFLIRIDRGTSYRELLNNIASELGLLESKGRGKDRKTVRIQSSKLLDMICYYVESQEDTPIIIIDEAEEIPNGTLRKLKNLYTATEGLMSIVIVGISKTSQRIAKLAGLSNDWMPTGVPSNEYTTFARRLRKFDIPNISADDIRIFCNSVGIKNEKIIEIAQVKWWNYDEADFRVKLAKKYGFDLAKITKAEFELLHN